MKTKIVFMGLFVALILASCAPTAQVFPTETAISTSTVTPTITPTLPPTPTSTPAPVYVILGSPFSSECGDGIPRIWSNDSFNASGDHQFDEHHGHVDIFVPKGCNINNITNEFIAIADGYVSPYEHGLSLELPKNVYPTGIESAFKFVGYNNLALNRISSIIFYFGHVKSNGTLGDVKKGQSLGEIVLEMGHQKVGYQVVIMYKNTSYMMTPSLFEQDPQWVCVPGSPYDCEPEPLDYVK